MSEQMIPLRKIQPPEWNSRLPESVTPQEIESLAQSMKAEGQLNAVNVEGPLPESEGTPEHPIYRLIAGSRRCRAAALLGWAEIRANVQPLTDRGTRIIQNIIENLQRKDLTPYEQARAVNELRSEKIPLKVIAEKTGLSVPHVSNLDVTYRSLPTHLLKEWQANEPAASITFLRSLAQVKGDTKEAVAEEQIRLYQERKSLYTSFAKDLDSPEEDDSVTEEAESDSDDSSEDSEDNGEPSKKTAKAFKVDRVHFHEVVAAVKAARLPGTPVILSLLDLTVGKRQSVKGIFPVPSKSRE
jgi:ParB/RepB/Spo0J family partition protein